MSERFPEWVPLTVEYHCWIRETKNEMQEAIQPIERSLEDLETISEEGEYTRTSRVNEVNHPPLDSQWFGRRWYYR